MTFTLRLERRSTSEAIEVSIPDLSNPPSFCRPEAGNTQTYGYDFAGNRSGNGAGGQFPLSSFLPGTLSGYDSQNRLKAGQYNDGRGNLNAIGSYAFAYDAENRLATAQLNTTETFGYDGNGQRVTKTRAGRPPRMSTMRSGN